MLVRVVLVANNNEGCSSFAYLVDSLNVWHDRFEHVNVHILKGEVISWKSTKQTCIVKSIMGSKFIAFEEAGSKDEWIKNLVLDMPSQSRPKTSIYIHCDYQVAIVSTKNKICSGKSWHISLRHKIVRQLIENNVISMDFVRLEKNLAHPLTKTLARTLGSEISRGMELMPINRGDTMETQPLWLEIPQRWFNVVKEVIRALGGTITLFCIPPFIWDNWWRVIPYDAWQC